ncbi:hypothetical protein H4R18_003405 [Coemansia javaensis]|uniref:SWI/SNF-like complex subunit BAF250 C-terminal domain-containing protein n=1 Tax=Coemansia javaensis TaxID=2761396 RepID=A0A9W8HET2_9FUNG|nr:hypothetical protein H4R18_003405 [Coemansia javaensis]
MPGPAAQPEGQPAVSVVTIPAPQQPLQPLRFFPLERSVDTYGGVDLQACAALRPRVRLPAVGEYGSVDVRALALSIESGIVMEVTNALNTLIQITAHPDVALPLGQCEELAEALFGIIETIQLPGARPAVVQAPLDGGGEAAAATKGPEPTYSDETMLFGEACVGDPSAGGLVGDDMQDPTAVRGLLRGCDALWSFTSDRTLTVVYALRNLSFLPANQDFFAASSDFAHAFEAAVAKCAAAVRADRTEEGPRGAAAAAAAPTTSLTVLRALEFRKSLVIILANVAGKIDLQTVGVGFVRAALRLIGYFVDDGQTSSIAAEWLSECVADADPDPVVASFVHVRAMDGRAYYLHALDAAARMTTSSRNREALVAAVGPDVLWPLAAACSALLAGHQAAVAAAPAAQHRHAGEQRLMWVQMALLVLSNLASAATPQALVAARKYTPLRISPDAAATSGGSGSGSAGPASGSLPPSGAACRAAARRPMPFLPAVYAAAAVPEPLRGFRARLAGDAACVRALFGLVLQWWAQASAAAGGQPAVALQLCDSPLGDLAERAVYVLQLLHPEHDALFESRWAAWVVEHIAAHALPQHLVEILCELVGIIAVQPVPS